MYSPSLGRFIQPDSNVPGAGNPQAYNRYSYVLNDPVNFADPSGHKPCWATSNYSCDLRGFDAGNALSKYNPADWAAVIKFFENHGFQFSSASDSGGGAPPVTPTAPAGPTPPITPTVPVTPTVPITPPPTPMPWQPTPGYYTAPTSNSEMCSGNNGNGCIVGGALLIVFTDFFVGLPAAGVIIGSGGVTPPAVAAEALETLVVLPVNVFGIYLISKGLEVKNH
jgi:hypothetical protein